MTRISFRRHRYSRASWRLGSCRSAAKIFHSFEKYLVSKSIDTDFAINSISCECSLGPSRNPAQWRVSSHPVTVTTAAHTGNIFSKHRQNIFEFCDGFCRKTWAELTTEVSRKSGFSPCNTIYSITDIQLPPQTHNLRHQTFTEC